MTSHKYDKSESDDFNDFFDTADLPANASAKQAVKHEKNGKADSDRQTKVRNERRKSSDHETHTNYSSDSLTHSDSDYHGRSRRRQEKRQSQGSSSRNGDSSVSDNSRSRSPRQTEDRRSRSRSMSSSSSSRSRTTSSHPISRNKEVIKRKAKVSQRRDSNSSGSSSDNNSEGSIQHGKPHAEAGYGARNQAWSTESKPRKGKQTDLDNGRRTSSGDIGKGSHKQRSRDKEHSPVHTDSDMTDVSPISSPCNSFQKASSNMQDTKPPKCRMRATGVKAGSERTHRDERDNALDMNLLMNAVSELEKQTRVQSNTRRVMFDSSWTRRELKSNYTFSDSDTHRIEQENKRLLRQIMCQMHSMDGRYFGSTNRGKRSVMPASGINRLRDHHRIEKENLELLKRIHQVKPSRSISRQEQLSAYNSTLLRGVPITTMHKTTTCGHRMSSKSKAGSETGSLGQTRSLTSVQSAATTSSLRSGRSGLMRSRPSSAKVSLSQRPPWDDRW